VLVEDRIGQYDIRIVLDCKDYKSPVDIKDVEECAGLFEDVSAQRGVIVCPAGFTKSAKAKAQQLQIDLYSPIDTDPHKWQARLKIPAICDFRQAMMSFRWETAAAAPFSLPSDFFTSAQIFDQETGEQLGTTLSITSAEWEAGRYPTDPGTYDYIPIVNRPLKMDNSYGTLIPVRLSVGLIVTQYLFFGQYPIARLSGFHDRVSDGIITNAIEFGLLSLEEIHSWKRLSNEAEAPVKPVIRLSGLYAWSDENPSGKPFLDN
jgi:hypothetical protein